MADDGVEVFIKWLRHHGVTSDKVRPYFTVAILVSDSETFSRLREEGPVGSLDELLAEEILSFADPRQTVAMLKSRIGTDISADMFRKVFDRTLAASSDIEVLSGLMWGAGMYLDRHPGAFPLPRKLADQLLASKDFDQRLAGLKALRHSGASSNEIVAQITTALKQDDWHERWAGLSNLELLLEERGSEVAGTTEDKTLEELQDVLARIADTDPDANACRAAARCSELLGKQKGPENAPGT